MNSREIENELRKYEEGKSVGNWLLFAEIAVGLLTAWAGMHLCLHAIGLAIDIWMKKDYGESEQRFADSAGKAALFLFLTALGAAAVYMIHRAQKQQVKKCAFGYKKIVVDEAAEGLFDEYSYQAAEGFPRSEIKETGLIKMKGKYASEDLVEGSCKNVTFRRADVALESRLTSSFHFRGSWSVFAFNKDFSSDLQIVTKDFRVADTNANSADGIEFGTRHRIETENEKFNKAFTCYCQNDSEAFYLLTPRLMEALLEADLLLGYPLMVGFVGNKLHFVIHSDRNYLEPPTDGGSLHLREEIEKVRCELKAVRFVIDALSIDQEIFKVGKRK